LTEDKYKIEGIDVNSSIIPDFTDKYKTATITNLLITVTLHYTKWY